jgi:hypothetical protein
MNQFDCAFTTEMVGSSRTFFFNFYRNDVIIIPSDVPRSVHAASEHLTRASLQLPNSRSAMMKEIDYFHLPLTEADVKWDTQSSFEIIR